MKYQLYIHTPYCLSKCAYCAFFSVCKKPDWIKYESSVIRDISYWKNELSDIELESIYFGGGTPTLMPEKTFEKIINAIFQNFKTIENIEISMESNPKSITSEKLKSFKNIGLNRLSIGVQSLNDKNLNFLGRIHTANEALEFVENGKKFFKNISCDFIYGLPNQDLKEFETELKKIKDLDTNHLSLYELSIEKKSVLEKKGFKPTDSEIGLKFYSSIQKILGDKYNRYEISNYAKTGFECQHNKNIWQGKPYIGVGPASAGRIIKDNNWYETYTPINIEKWEQEQTTEIKKLSISERNTEKIILGLRTIYGLELNEEIKSSLDFNYIKNNQSYFILKENNLTLTNSGQLILDTILPYLIK